MKYRDDVWLGALLAIATTATAETEVPTFYLAPGPDQITAWKTSEVGSYDWAIRWRVPGTETWVQTGYSGDDYKTATDLADTTYEVQGRNRLAGVYSVWSESQYAAPSGVTPPDDPEDPTDPDDGEPPPYVPPPSEALGVSVFTATDIAEGVYDGITVGPDHLYLRQLEAVVPDSVWVEIPYAGSAYVVVRDESGFGPFAHWYPVAPDSVLVPYDPDRWLDVSGFTAGDLFKWARLYPPRGW